MISPTPRPGAAIFCIALKIEGLLVKEVGELKNREMLRARAKISKRSRGYYNLRREAAEPMIWGRETLGISAASSSLWKNSRRRVSM
jgi:hypothetical protein